MSETRKEIAELEEEVRTLTERTLDMQAQLADRARVYPDGHEFAGRRMTDHDYHEWRAKCVYALNKTIADMRAAKADLRDARMEMHSERVPEVMEREVPDILPTLYRLAKRAITEYGYAPSPKEQEALDLYRSELSARQ